MKSEAAVPAPKTLKQNVHELRELVTPEMEDRIQAYLDGAQDGEQWIGQFEFMLRTTKFERPGPDIPACIIPGEVCDKIMDLLRHAAHSPRGAPPPGCIVDAPTVHNDPSCTLCGTPMQFKCPKCGSTPDLAGGPRGAQPELEMREGWMDSIDFEHEVGHALGGNAIYPSEADLREHRKCLDTDGECTAMRVYVVNADEYDKVGPEAQADPDAFAEAYAAQENATLKAERDKLRQDLEDEYSADKEIQAMCAKQQDDLENAAQENARLQHQLDVACEGVKAGMEENVQREKRWLLALNEAGILTHKLPDGTWGLQCTGSHSAEIARLKERLIHAVSCMNRSCTWCNEMAKAEAPLQPSPEKEPSK
jgi:hypothetical protein